MEQLIHISKGISGIEGAFALKLEYEASNNFDRGIDSP